MPAFWTRCEQATGPDGDTDGPGPERPCWRPLCLRGEGPVAQEYLGLAQAGNCCPSLEKDPVRCCLVDDTSYRCW